MFRGKAKRALSHDVSAAVIRNRRGKDLRSARSARVDQHGDRIPPNHSGGVGGEGLPRDRLPRKRANRAAGQEEARHRDRFRNLPAAAIAHIQDDLADALFFGLQYAIVHFVRSSAIERRQAESKDIRIDFLAEDLLWRELLSNEVNGLRIDADMTNDGNPHRCSRLATEQIRRLTDRHVARGEAGNRVQDISAMQGRLLRRAIRHDGNHDDVAKSLAQRHTGLGGPGIRDLLFVFRVFTRRQVAGLRVKRFQ